MIIKARLISLSALGAITLLILLAIGWWYDRSSQDTARYLEEINELVADLESMEVATTRFILTLDAQNEEAFYHHQTRLRETLQLMESHSKGQILDEVRSLNTSAQRFDSEFKRLVELRTVIGLTPKSGLYGELRNAVHDVESVLKEEQDYRMLADMLQLRRNEKDFMLRLDLKYLQRFQSNIEKFKESIALSITFSPVQQNELYGFLAIYQKAFEALVAAEVEVGLSANEGVRQKLAEAEQEAMAELLKTVALVKQQSLDSRSTFALSAGLVTLLLIALSIAITTWISVGIRGKISQLQRFLGQVIATRDLALRAEANGVDEMAQMSQALNQLLDMFQKLVSQVNSASAVLDGTVERLSEQSERANEGAHNQLRESELVATAATEMGQTVGEIANNTENAAEHARLTFDDANRGRDEVNHSVEQIQSLASKLTHASEEVNELAEQSNTIGDVLSVIRGIAEQTNLLALNAAIEAARAGEMGRGFAVVADEVRSLATRTQESTEEIASIIGALQNKTQSITGLMSDCQQSGQEGAYQVTNVGQVLERIVEAMSGILQLNTEIAAATDQQSQVSHEVSEKVQLIRDIALATSSASEQNVAAAKEVSSQSHQLRQHVSEFHV